MRTFRWRVLANAAVVAFALLACSVRPASGGYFSKVGKPSEKVSNQDSGGSKDSKASRDVSKPGTGQVKPQPTGFLTSPFSGLQQGPGNNSSGARASGGYPSDKGTPQGVLGGTRQWGGGLGTVPKTAGTTGPQTNSGTSAWGRAGKGGVFGNLQTRPSSGTGGQPIATVPGTTASRPVTARGSGGFFGNLQTSPGNGGGAGASQPVVGDYYGSTSGRDSRPVVSSSRDWRPTISAGRTSFFATVDRIARPQRTGSGYFDTMRRLIQAQGRSSYHDRQWWWYYPYDFRFYHWYYGYYDPFAPSYPFAAYVVGPPPLVLVTPPALWITIWGGDGYRYSGDEDYYPYVDRADGSLAQALRDIERGWQREDAGLLMRHVDPDGEIRVLYRKEYSHTLRADEFQQLTEEAFANTRTESFRFTSVKQRRDGDEAVAKGKHVLRDPNGESRVVYVIYLMEQARDRYGDWDWYITEVGQSPEPY